MRLPTCETCSFIAAEVAEVEVPSNRTRTGKLMEACVENFFISSAAKVASAPFGRNDRTKTAVQISPARP